MPQMHRAISTILLTPQRLLQGALSRKLINEAQRSVFAARAASRKSLSVTDEVGEDSTEPPYSDQTVPTDFTFTAFLKSRHLFRERQ